MTGQEAHRLSPVDLRWEGRHTLLEPEEARMLARFVVEAADEWQRLSVRERAPGRRPDFIP